MKIQIYDVDVVSSEPKASRYPEYPVTLAIQAGADTPPEGCPSDCFGPAFDLELRMSSAKAEELIVALAQGIGAAKRRG